MLVSGTAVILSALLVMIMMNDHLPTEMGDFPVLGKRHERTYNFMLGGHVQNCYAYVHLFDNV